MSKCALLAVLLALVSACAGQTDEPPAPADPSDPGVLPTGTYALTIRDASCNVNDASQSGKRTMLVRNHVDDRLLANVPVPTADGVVGLARQDLDLRVHHVEFDHAGERCATVHTSIDVTELTATRLALSYRDAPVGCDVPACSVDYALDLVEAACPRACDPSGASPTVGADGSITWRCACEVRSAM